MDKCFFCKSTETKYCGMCQKHLCNECRKNYWKRLKGAIREGIDKL